MSKSRKFEFHESQTFETFELLEACPVVNFMTSELVEVCTSWPGHPVIKKYSTLWFYNLYSQNSVSSYNNKNHMSLRLLIPENFRQQFCTIPHYTPFKKSSPVHMFNSPSFSSLLYNYITLPTNITNPEQIQTPLSLSLYKNKNQSLPCLNG